MDSTMDQYRTAAVTCAFWHPVYRSEELKPGWAKPIKIMSESFTLYRRGDGRSSHRRASLRPSRTATLGRVVSVKTTKRSAKPTIKL
jgi:hypothetical protein